MKSLIRIIAIFAGLALFIVVFFIYLRPNLILSKVVEKSRYAVPESKFLHWKGAEMHYTDTGQGPVILMIHGFGGSFNNFAPLAEQLQDSFRVICMDLPGFGLSDMPDLPDAHIDYITLYHNYINYFIDHLHLDSIYVIGNSMGGWVGWKLAIQRTDKVKKLILLDAAGYETDKVKHNLGIDKLGNPFVDKILEKGLPLWMSKIGAHKIRTEDEPLDMDEVRESNALLNREGSLQNIINMANSKQGPDTTQIPKVPCPTLIIWGQEDQVIPYQHALKFRRDIRNSKMIIYENCGHVPMMEYPQRVAIDVRKFIKGN